METVSEEFDDTSPIPPPDVLGREASHVWSIFSKIEEIVDGKKVPLSQCSICRKKLSRGPRSGTNHLRRHLKRHADAESQDIRQMHIGQDALGNMSKFKFDKAVARKEVVDFVIRAELPFTFVEKHDFKGFIQRAFAPQYTGISASTCKRDVMKIFSQAKIELLAFFEKFEGKVCLTSDLWSSRQKVSYSVLTAHYIDKDWCLNKRVISFKMLEYPHTGEILANHISEELVSWGIQSKIFSISLDNASNNDVVVQLLPDFLMIESIPRELFHVRCCAHILNLIVQDGLEILAPSIIKITTIIRNMNSSNKRFEVWKQCCTSLGFAKRSIDNDVPHRWNSTCDLLQIALKYRSPMHMYVQKVNQMRSCKLAVPNEQDWLIAELVGGFLEVFRSATQICCGVYYPTSSRVINCLFDIHQTFEAYSHLDIFNDALVAMKTKFDKYWYDFPLVFCCATVMDPRFKLFAIEEWLRCMGRGQLEIDGIIQSIKTLLYKYYEVYKRNTVPSVVLPNSGAYTPLSTTSSSIPIPRVQSYSMQSLKRAKISSTSSSSNNNSDLQIYLDLATIEVDDDNQFSLLGWWKANQPLYPILSLMARDLLSVPASTVASEAAFSAGGRVVSEKRASLSPNTIEALICSKDWSLAKSRKQDSAEAKESAEELMGTMTSRPDWMIGTKGGTIEADSEEDSATHNESELPVD